jgi:hypothetical protein
MAAFVSPVLPVSLFICSSLRFFSPALPSYLDGYWKQASSEIPLVRNNISEWLLHPCEARWVTSDKKTKGAFGSSWAR